jgi:hypothetical protein
MRGVIYLLLILAAVIVVGVIWLGIHPQSWLPQVSSALSAIGPSPKSAPANPSGKPKPFDEKSRAHSRDGRPIPEGPRSAIEPASTTPASAPAPEIRHYRFPLAQEIQSGTARSALVALFGPPQATVAGADLGQLQERLIYLDPPTKRRTLISLVNGSVTFAETLAQ